LKVSYTVSETLWSFVQGKLDPQTIRNWHFRRPHTSHAQDEFAVLLTSCGVPQGIPIEEEPI